jgi:hypothetical protein
MSLRLLRWDAGRGFTMGSNCRFLKVEGAHG